MPDLLINIDVEDLEKALDFYVEALGLRPGRRFGGLGVELLGAPAPIYLLQKPAGGAPFSCATAGRIYARHWTPVHLDFPVEDLEAAIRRATGSGAKLEGEIDERAWGRLARLADPFGHGFCLLQFKGSGYDELTGGASG